MCGAVDDQQPKFVIRVWHPDFSKFQAYQYQMKLVDKEKSCVSSVSKGIVSLWKDFLVPSHNIWLAHYTSTSSRRYSFVELWPFATHAVLTQQCRRGFFLEFDSTRNRLHGAINNLALLIWALLTVRSHIQVWSHANTKLEQAWLSLPPFSWLLFQETFTRMICPTLGWSSWELQVGKAHMKYQ